MRMSAKLASPRIHHTSGRSSWNSHGSPSSARATSSFHPMKSSQPSTTSERARSRRASRLFRFALRTPSS